VAVEVEVGVAVGVGVAVEVAEGVKVAVGCLVGVLVAVGVADKALTARVWLRPIKTTTNAVKIKPRATPPIIQLVCRSNLGNNKYVSK
jgi:hypothetical protein